MLSEEQIVSSKREKLLQDTLVYLNKEAKGNGLTGLDVTLIVKELNKHLIISLPQYEQITIKKNQQYVEVLTFVSKAERYNLNPDNYQTIIRTVQAIVYSNNEFRSLGEIDAFVTMHNLASYFLGLTERIKRESISSDITKVDNMLSLFPISEATAKFTEEIPKVNRVINLLIRDLKSSQLNIEELVIGSYLLREQSINVILTYKKRVEYELARVREELHNS